MDAIEKVLKIVKKSGLYPEILIVDSDNSKDPFFKIEGKSVLSFNSCNYLGLSNYREVKKVVSASFDKFGVHPSNSPLVSGIWDTHRNFEKKLARFFGYEDCMLFTSTANVNIGVIPAIANLPIGQFFPLLKIYIGNADTTIFSDELNHATIVDGCRISNAKIEVYKHLDFLDLEEKLKKSKSKRKIIVTDGIFSMDGHVLDLPRMLELKKKYNCLLYVDDAHSIGVMGKGGRGLQSHFKTTGIDFYVASLSKGFGLTGGCVCASKDFIDFLRVTSRTYIFSRTFLTPIAEGGIKVLEILDGQEGEKRLKRLWTNTELLISGLNKIGFNTLDTKTPIVPILIGDEKKAINIARDLYREGIYAPAMRWPAVKKGEARLRFMLTALHDERQVNRLIDLLEKYGRINKVIR